MQHEWLLALQQDNAEQSWLPSWWNAEKTTSTKSLGHFDALTEFCKYQLYVNLLEQNWPSGALSRTQAAAFTTKRFTQTLPPLQWRGGAFASKYNIQDGGTKC